MYNGKKKEWKALALIKDMQLLNDKILQLMIRIGIKDAGQLTKKLKFT